MISILRQLRAGAAGVLLAAIAFAFAQAQPAQFQPVELTMNGASAALGAMPGVYQVGQSYAASVPPAADNDPLGGLGNLALSNAALAQLNATVGAYGFASYEDWVLTIQSLFHAYAWLQAAPALQQLGPALNAAVQQVLANPNLTQEQKDAILAQMGAANTAAAASGQNTPSDNNQQIASALSPQIQQTIQFLQSQP